MRNTHTHVEVEGHVLRMVTHPQKHHSDWCISEASTCMLMCTSSEPWPSTLAWSMQGWRSPWKCVKEKAIGPLMESIRFRALTLSYWEVSSARWGSPHPSLGSGQWTWVLCGHGGHFTTRGRASIKKTQTIANDLAVNHMPSFNPRSINKTENETNAPYVI